MYIYTFMWTYEQVINMEGYILIGKAELSDTGQDEQAWIGGRNRGIMEQCKGKNKMVSKVKHL